MIRTLVPVLALLATPLFPQGSASPGDRPGHAVPEVPGGSEAAALTGLEPIAEIEVVAPEPERFVLRATLPVPPEVHPRPDRLVPFLVRDKHGVPFRTQVQTVTRFADGARGADVVEVSALVLRPAGADPGDRMTFRVFDEPHAPTSPLFHPDVREFGNGSMPLRLTARDAFGNVYAAELSTANAVRLRDGSVVREWRTYETLLPEETGGSELPHLFGIHGYVRIFAEEPVLQLDLRIHNGFTGLDPADTVDDPLGEVYFEDLRLELPEGWTALESFSSPYAGAVPGEHAYFVVRPMEDGTLHYMPHQGQLVRRLTLARTEQAGRAAAYAAGGGQGFALRGQSESGVEYHSWWNPTTAAYYPQRTRLPELDHVDLGQVRVNLAQRFSALAGHVREGTTPGYPVEFGALGWAHPWGQQESGEAGGQEIFLYDGVRTAASASLDGLRWQTLKHRMYVDRHKSAFYDKDGTPIEVDDWVTQSPDGQHRWVPFLYFGVPIRTWEHDPFGYDDSPSFQREYAEANDLVPSYRNTLRDYLAIDIEHLVRYTGPAKVLVWLANDSLAKDSLRMEAQAFRAGYHEYPIDQWGWKIDTGLGRDLEFTAQHPGQGMSFGRLEGWGIDACNAVYAFEDDAYRARLRPWYDKVLTAVERGQSDCLGIIQADLGDQFFEGRYRTRQSIEQAIVENMLTGIRRRVYARVDPVAGARLDHVLTRSFYSMVQAPAWDFVRSGPFGKLAVGHHDVADGLFCSNPPPDGTTDDLDRYQTWCSFAYAHALTDDDLFLRRVSEMSGGGDPLVRQRQMGLENLENRVALLAYLQRP